METRTYYFPATRMFVHIMNHITRRVGCSIGDIHRVGDKYLAVNITTLKHEFTTIERILHTYDLM